MHIPLVYLLALTQSQIASELWPIADVAHELLSEDEEPDTELSLEAQIANEVSAMKRPRSQNPAQRFCKCAPLLLFVSSDSKI